MRNTTSSPFCCAVALAQIVVGVTPIVFYVAWKTRYLLKLSVTCSATAGIWETGRHCSDLTRQGAGDLTSDRRMASTSTSVTSSGVPFLELIQPIGVPDVAIGECTRHGRLLPTARCLIRP